MKPVKLKTSEEKDLNTIFRDYVSKNYGEQAFTPNLQSYFSSFNQNRNVISHSKDNEHSINILKTTLQISIQYLNQIIALKTKMIFGKENYCCTIDFCWTDTIKGNMWHSNDINFEYYNILFNIACLYFRLGYEKSLLQNINKQLRKEAIKDYKHSLYLFEILKKEAHKKIAREELPIDLWPEYCEYFSTLCIIYGQIEIVKIAEETSPNDFSVRGKLILGICENYIKAYQLSKKEPTNFGGDENFRNYLLNRCNYYKGMMFKKYSEISKQKFDNTGQGFGEAVLYQQLCVSELTQCQKTINSCSVQVDVNLFNALLEEEKKNEKILTDLNNRVYHQYLPNPNTLNFESKILLVPLNVDEIYIGENANKYKNDPRVFCEDLNNLTTKEIKQMLTNYKNTMQNFLKDFINKYENEKTIEIFIKSLNLPNNLSCKKEINIDSGGNNSIPPHIWDKILKIQQIGGTKALSNKLKNILNKSSDLLSKLQNILIPFENEEKDDATNRKTFGNLYNIKPSNIANKTYVQAIKNNISNINQSMSFDQKEKNIIIENAKNFEILLNTKENLEKKIPNSQTNQKKEEEIKAREEILKLYKLGDECSNIINPLLKTLENEGNIISQFALVLSNKATEYSVTEMNKEKYMSKLQGLKKLNEDIKVQKKNVMDAVSKLPESTLFPDINNTPAKYFEDLEKNANKFLEELNKLNKGENYYNSFEQKINKLSNDGNLWLENRKKEKQKIISNLISSQPQAPQNPFTSSQIQKYAQGQNYYTPETQNQNYPQQNNNNNYGMQPQNYPNPNNNNNGAKTFTNNDQTPMNPFEDVRDSKAMYNRQGGHYQRY